MIVADIGRALLSDAQDLIDRLNRLKQYAASVRGDQVREISIVAGAFAAESVCMAAAGRMLALYPHYRLHIKALNWAEVPRALNEREATIGVMDVRGLASDADLEVERLRPQPGVFVVRPAHPLVGRTTVDLADIMAFPLLAIGRRVEAIQAQYAAAREEARSRDHVHSAFPAVEHKALRSH